MPQFLYLADKKIEGIYTEMVDMPETGREEATGRKLTGTLGGKIKVVIGKILSLLGLTEAEVELTGTVAEETTRSKIIFYTLTPEKKIVELIKWLEAKQKFLDLNTISDFSQIPPVPPARYVVFKSLLELDEKKATPASVNDAAHLVGSLADFHIRIQASVSYMPDPSSWKRFENALPVGGFGQLTNVQLQTKSVVIDPVAIYYDTL